MAKIRKQTYSLDQYLKLMNAETIRTDQECQRLLEETAKSGKRTEWQFHWMQ